MSTTATRAVDDRLFTVDGALVNPAHEAELREELGKAFRYGLAEGRRTAAAPTRGPISPTGTLSPALISALQAGEMLGMKPGSVVDLVKSGQLPGAQLDGRRWAIRPEDVYAYAAALVQVSA
jgi:hypothetical protein